jgi:hypothetical protein
MIDSTSGGFFVNAIQFGGASAFRVIGRLRLDAAEL